MLAAVGLNPAPERKKTGAFLKKPGQKPGQYIFTPHNLATWRSIDIRLPLTLHIPAL